MLPESLWLYCVLELDPAAPPPLPPDGFKGVEGATDLRLVPGGDGLAAVVSPAPLRRYRLERENLLAHQRVNEHFLPHVPALLPVRFGTVSPDAATVAGKVLHGHASLLKRNFPIVRGRREYGVRAMWTDPEAELRRLPAENASLRAQQEKILRLPPARQRDEAVRLGQVVKQLMDTRNTAQADALFAPLAACAVESKRNPVVASDAFVLNAVFLVDAAASARLESALVDLDSQWGQRMKFRLVGPAPAFNFVELALDLSD